MRYQEASTPLVSVVIPTYNRRRHLVEAIESVLAQTYQPLELIVVDDGSTDGTQEALSGYGDRVRVLRQENRGPSAARNWGIAHASGAFVAMLDSDDLWHPRKIEKQMAVMQEKPEVGLVFCRLTHLDQTTGRSSINRYPPDLRGDLRRRLLERNYIANSSVLVRKACFEKVGGYDETMKWAEDWDLWIRISRYFQFDFVDEPLLWLRRQGDNLQQQIERMHAGQIQCIRRAFEQDPVDRKNALLKRRCLAYIHCDAADEYRAAGKATAALRHLLHCVALWPFDTRYYRRLLSLLAGPILAR